MSDLTCCGGGCEFGPKIHRDGCTCCPDCGTVPVPASPAAGCKYATGDDDSCPACGVADCPRCNALAPAPEVSAAERAAGVMSGTYWTSAELECLRPRIAAAIEAAEARGFALGAAAGLRLAEATVRPLKLVGAMGVVICKGDFFADAVAALVPAGPPT